MAEHWTRALREENKRLRAALDGLMGDSWGIPQVIGSRFTKEDKYPSGGEYSLGYRAALQETDLRLREAIDQASRIAEGL